MKTIVTAYGSFATGTDLADAVTRYGVALARRQAMDVVDVPFVTADGRTGRVQLRVGWLCEMATVSVGGRRGELREDGMVLELMRRTQFVERHRPAPRAVRYASAPAAAAEPSWEEII